MHPAKGYEHIWHLLVELRKYMDLHYRQAVADEHIEHPYIMLEQRRHWVGLVPVT